MGGLSGRMLAVVLFAAAAACARGGEQVVTIPPAPADGGSGSGGGGADAGGGTPDAGPPDAGPPDGGGPDGGSPDAGPKFGGPGPWPMQDVTYGMHDGILETPVVGMSTDEKQNLWVATHAALYVLRPGEKQFKRFDIRDGLHTAGNPVIYCSRDYARDPNDPSGIPEADKLCSVPGDADGSGIQEIVGGGQNEVFVGYNGRHDWNNQYDGTWADPLRYTGQLDRVRLKLKADGTIDGLQVDRLQMMAGNSPAFWHNRDVMRLVYDHLKHPHELFVGTNHGITRFTPDGFKDVPPLLDHGNPVGIEYFPDQTFDWMSDHVHPQACACGPCVGELRLLLGDWRGLAIDRDGNLLVGGRWAAGRVVWVKENATPDGKGGWFQRGGGLYDTSKGGYNMGDPYDGNCGGSRPVWCVPREGDAISISAVAQKPDGVDWFASGPYGYQPGQACPKDPTGKDRTAGDHDWGVASYEAKNHRFEYYSPTADLGMVETNVRDMVALPDGRLVFAGPNSGIVFWNPNTKKVTGRMRGGSGLPSDKVYRLEVDRMVDPPVLHVSTELGATSIRILP